MARPTTEAAAASRTIGAIPNFSVSGFGTGFEGLTSYLPERFGVDLIRDMFLMARTDETFGAMMYCIATTMRQISWDFVPQIDGVDAPEDAEAKKYAEFMRSVLMDMNQPFHDHVEDALTMLWAGFAPIEIVTKRRDGKNSRFTDGYYGVRALNLLDQTTVWDFKYEDDELVAMQQVGINVKGDGVIPLFKTLLFRTSTQYNNPRGRPLMEPAWRAWRLKRKIQDSEALGIERELCGLPIFEMPEEVINAQFETDANGDLTDDAKQARAMVQAAKQATQDMRLNKSGGLVIPSSTYGDEYQGGGTTKRYDFRILTTAGTRSIDSRTAARDYDHAIARVGMMQFLTLGQRSGGSYGLSEDQSSMAVASIMALGDKITSEWNAKGIPLIWAVNAMPDKYRPRMKHSEVNKNGITQLGQFMGGVGKAADLWGGDAAARVAILKAGNLPYDYDSQVRMADSFQKKAEAEAQPKPTPVAAPVAKNDPAEDEED